MTRMIRRLLSLALCAAMLAALIPAAFSGFSAQADSTTLGVTTTEVNFRAGPSMRDKLLFRIPKNTVCGVITRLTSDGYDWYQITALDPDSNYTREYTGYVRSEFFRMLTDEEAAGRTEPGAPVNPNPTPVVTPAANDGEIQGYVMTIVGSVNVRASIGGTSLTQVGIYETFPYLLPPVKRGNYTWYFIQLKNGTKGYVRGDCVKIAKGPSGTPTTAPVITPTSPGTTPTPTPAAPDYSTPTGFVKTTMDDVNIRKGIWGDRIAIARKKGTVYPYYGSPRTSGKTKWYFIYDSSFGYGYIHGGYVEETDKRGSIVTPTPTQVPVITPTPSPTPVITPIVPGGGSGKNEATYTTLRPGSSGIAVENLVRELFNQGYYSGTVTNKYNSRVENAVRAFQKAQGLAVDGIAGSNTQHALFNTVPVGTADLSNLTMTLYPAEKIDWYTGGINELWPRGSNFKIYDVYTGIVWWAHRWAGGLHIDAEPLTAADTARLCQIYGVKTASEITEKTHWQRRPCLVTIGTRTFACSLYGVPHNPDGDTIADNNFVGQLCIHFTNSKIHGTKVVDSGHQAAIQYAWENAPNGHK